MNEYNQQQGGNMYQQPPPVQPAYQQHPPKRGAGNWPPMTLGNWIVTLLLMLIPIANIILIFMWAFGGNVNPSKKSYFQAMLIFYAVAILLGILLGGALWGALASLMNSVY